MKNVRSGVFAVLVTTLCRLVGPVAIADTVPMPAPLPSLPPGSPIPPPGPAGCLCRCPQILDTPADRWFCGSPCDAIAADVTLLELKDWVAENCFPMRAGVDPLECVSCLEETFEYMKRYCECQGSFTCDRDGNATVDCEDLRVFLDFKRGNCISRTQLLELVCCFLRHIQPLPSAGGCGTTFSGGCGALKTCLQTGLYKPGDNPFAPEHPVFDPPLTTVEIDGLLRCYGCDCCKSVGTHGAMMLACDDDGPECDQDGNGVVDCADFNRFLDQAEVCTGVGHGGLSSPQLMDLACAFFTKCVPCKDLPGFIDCLEERLCRVLSVSEMAALEACPGLECSIDDCCQSISATSAWGGSTSTSASYAACGGTIRCDQNCDGKVDCSDFLAFVNESKSRCNDGAAYSREQVLLLACAFGAQCGNEELCSCMLETLDGYFASLPTPGAALSEEERAHLAQCMPCGQVCAPTDSGAQPGEPCVAGTRSAQPLTGDCDCGDGGAKSSPPRSAEGVVLQSGASTLAATDALVKVPGPDLLLQRAYTSDPAYGSSCATGRGWSESQFQHVVHDPGAGTLAIHMGARRQATVDVSAGAKLTDSSTGLDFWRVPGNSTLIVHKSLASYNGATYAVWRLREPGGASTDYFRQPDAGETSAASISPALVGLIAGVTDVYSGNSHHYRYGLWLGAGGTPVARLKQVLVNPGSGSAPPAARLDYSYLWRPGVNEGRLRQVSVFRPDAQGAMTLVEQVEYRYRGADDILPANLSTDCGTDGDLVLVIHRERVDPSPSGAWPMWRDRVTHYRYHGGTTALSGASGAAHQLKMVVLPEQVEFAAAAWVAAYNAANAPDITTTATRYAIDVLLNCADIDSAWGTGGQQVADLASQVNLSYSLTGSSNPITTIWSQGGCGCGGPGSGSSHRVLTYNYVAAAPLRRTVAVDETPGPTASSFRRYWYETYSPSGSGPQYLRSKAVEELDGSHATTHRAWVNWYSHDSASRMLVRERLPSTFPNGIGTTGSYDYRPGTTGSAPVYGTSASGGLSRRYAYVASSSTYGYRLLASEEVGQGASPSTWILTRTYEYGDVDGAGTDWTTTNSRGWLLSRERAYRTSGGTGSGASDIEETQNFYGFASSGSDQVMWSETRVEAETVSENGPGGTYSSFELFDAQGQNTWSVAADMAVTKRDFGSPSGQYAIPTGQAQQVTRNAPTTGLSSPYFGLVTTGFGRTSSGGALTTSYRRDLLGRVIETVAPGSFSTYTMRYMDVHPTRASMPSYVELTLPFQWVEGSVPQSAGAASVTWMSASGRPLGTSQYEVKPVLYTMGSGGDASGSGWAPRVTQYALDAELGRTVTRYRYNGLVDAQDYWAQLVASTDDAPFGGAFSTAYKYDSLGRLEMRASPNGTVTGYEHDVLDRVVRESTSVMTTAGSCAPWPCTLTATREYGFDGGTPSTPAIGDGNLTSQTALIASGLDRTTSYTYDFRDRRTITQAPQAPHELVVFDNLDRVIRRGVFSSVPTSMTNTNRGAYTETAYSQRGLVYQQRIATVPSAASPTFLETNRWFDEAGRVVGEWSPTAVATKTTYDGLGRATVVYATDRGGDPAPGASGNYAAVHAAHASVLTGDVVLEEHAQDFASSSGLPTLATTRMRAHNAPATLTGAFAGFTGSDRDYIITSYAAAFYDPSLRPIRQVEYGTNRSSPFLQAGTSSDIPSLTTVPDWDSAGDQIVHQTHYDTKGRVDRTTDPTGHVTAFQYDMADRRIAVIEGWDSTCPPVLSWGGLSGAYWTVGSCVAAATPDVNRTTTFVYDGVGATVRLTAYNAPALATMQLQHTTYHYGVDTSGTLGSALKSNDLLSYVEYPNVGGLSSVFTVYSAYAYNRQGEVVTMEEGKGNSPVGGDTSSRHSYVRDLLGRVTVDSVTAFGADIDDSVDALAYDFDSLGRFSRGRSYKGYVIGSTPPSTPLDDVVFSYTGLWEVSHVLQSSRGDTTGAYARTVSYAYDTQPVSGGNYSRLQTLTYPDGATQGFKYGASSSTPDSRISRATQLDLGSTALVGYGYIGMGTVAVTDYKVPGIQLDRYRAPSGATAVGSYPGLDKFGRVLRQMWVDTGFTTGSGGNPDRPPVDSTLYAYTKSSDRTQAVDDRPGAAQPLSQGYDYDKLHRLVEAARGTWTGATTPPVVPTEKGSQRWHDDTGAVTLDALGNWRFSWTDLDGSGSYSDATERDDRTHDIFNRIVGHVLKGQGSGGTDLNLGDLTYDRASNLASWKLQSGTAATAVTAKHDAWNRLTEVSFGGSLRCRQAHNALHWRSFQLSDRTGAGAAPDGTMDQARLMSYGADWRLLEERVDDNLSLSAWTEGTWSPGTDLDRVQQYVWGTRYVDDIVLHRVDKNIDGDYSDPGDGTWHHLTDAQFSSVCLIDKAFAIAERVTYAAYGVATHIPMADLNCDGAVNGADIPGLLTAFGSIGSSPYQSPADLNRDGVVNSADLAMLLGDFQAAQPDGALSRPNVDNPIGWDGYVFDRESGLYTVRFRTYETGLGRWIERDPAGYVDGFNLWSMVSGGPIGNIDPEGLKRIALVLRGQSFFGLLGDSEELMQKTKEAIANQAGATIVAGGEDDDLFEVGRRKICDALVAGCKMECGTMASVIIVGHSNGGDAARKIAAQLKSPGCFGVPIDVELLVTLDPIGKPVHDREAVEQVSENVKRAVNFYQRQDRMHFYLPFSKGFRLWGYQLGGPNVRNLEVERNRFTARTLAHPWWVHGAVPNVVANDVGGLAAATSERNGANKCAELLKSARRASGQ